ncbi:MAG: LPS export ABC transporter periplasmic protein LptC [SAR324 cluster bacterium]|nr:LPS export ABC transporter periplasmic protein LptC [SAR324 cluster bacterium]
MASKGLHSYSSFLHENRKELAILLLIGAVAGAAYYFFHYSQPQEIIPLEERGVLDLQQITINDFQHERKSWKLIGNRAVVSEKSNRMRIEKVKIWVYAVDNSSDNSSSENSASVNNSSEQVALYITADQGLIEKHDNRVTLSGNVVLWREDGSEAHTETAIYDAKKEILTIPKPVRMLGEGHTMLGSGLTYDVSKGILNLKEPVLVRHDNNTVKSN